MDKLKPCPFCGHGENIEAVQDCGGVWFVVCHLCEVEGPASTNADGASERWNTRQAIQGRDELREWALNKAATHHRLAHENKNMRAEHIASSTAYRNLAEEIAALKSTVEGR